MARSSGIVCFTAYPCGATILATRPIRSQDFSIHSCCAKPFTACLHRVECGDGSGDGNSDGNRDGDND